MIRARILGASLGLVALTGAGVAAVATGATADAGKAGGEAGGAPATIEATVAHGGKVDPKLAVPPGNRLVGALEVERGVQTYQCTGNAWTFLEPNATLVNRRGTAVVLHTKGPVWISTVDGSAVNAAAVPGASVPREGAVPELLLKATANRGDGDLGRVTFIQRLNTRGGLAPTGSCTNGTQVGVPYKATYTFYAPAS